MKHQGKFLQTVTMSQFARILYQGIFKRSPTILLFAVVGAIFVEEGIDFTGTYIFRRINEGVSGISLFSGSACIESVILMH